MPAATITTKLSPDLARWLREGAEQGQVTQRAILEAALVRFREEWVKKDLAKSFRRAQQDPDLIQMAEWGMKDYSTQLKKLGL